MSKDKEDLCEIELDLPDEVYFFLVEECKKDNCTMDEKVEEILRKVVEDDKSDVFIENNGRVTLNIED